MAEADTPIDLAALRERLRNMTDRQLREFGSETRRIVDADDGNRSRDSRAVQLHEAMEEFNRRKEARKVGPKARRASTMNHHVR